MMRASTTLVVSLIGFLALGLFARADTLPERLKAAKAAVKQATAAEAKTRFEWASRRMARSATREIAVAARNTTERALQNLLAALENAKAKQAANNAAEAALWQKKAAERLTTLRGAADRMFNDQRVANTIGEELTLMEPKLTAITKATRAAERTVLVLQAEAAQQAAAEAKAKKAANVQELTAKAQAATKAIQEMDVIIAMEVQGWLGVRRVTLQQLIEGNVQAMEVANRLLATDQDAARLKTYQDFLGKVTALKVSEEKRADQLLQAIHAMDWDIYSLRVATLGGLKLIDPKTWDYAKARHLLVRAGFGGTPQEVAKLHGMGPLRAVEFLVDYHRQPPANVPFDAAPPPRLDPLVNKLRGDVRGQVAEFRTEAENKQFNQLRHWWLKRLVESPRPLQEKLTLFWHGHFATQYSVVRNSYTTYHQNQLFREHAAGNFGGLLYGLVHDPVMIRYLDNNTNVKGHANENLAREIMELFALGVDQGYTEKDIREAARALTGYTLDNATGQFRYIAKNHDDKPKTIFGKTGNWSGDDVVTLLLEQPHTGRFIAKKLFEYFAYLDPQPEVTDSLAAVLRGQGYELSPMLKNLFLAEEFYNDKTMGTQIKGPVQLVAGLFRDLGVKDVANYESVDAGLRDMGQDLLEPPDVKGWRGGRAWINSNRLFVRYNTVADLIKNVGRANHRRGVDVLALVEKSNCQTAADVVDYLARACFTKPLNPQKRQDLIAYLGTLPPSTEWANQRQQLNQKLQDLLVLMLCIPEHQLG